jgi:fibronectin type 3 domain-containing protein
MRRTQLLCTALVFSAASILDAGCSSSTSPSTTVPTSPTGVTATPFDGQVTIDWTPASGATSYNIYWSTTPGVTPASGAKIGNVLNPYTQNGVVDGTAYFYVVTAVNGAGESFASSQVSATPLARPAAPTGVVATPGDGQVTVTWAAVSGATSYNVYSDYCSPVTTSSTMASNATSPSTSSGLNNGTPYYFAVTAVNGSGESALSSEVVATPAAPAPAHAGRVFVISCG